MNVSIVTVSLSMSVPVSLRYKYVNHGYGTHRICGYLAENGMMTKEGNRFINSTIQNILKRPIYIGILSGGRVQSDVIPKL